MPGKRLSFDPPIAAFIPIAAGIVALLAMTPLHAQLPTAVACVPGDNRPPVAKGDSATTYLTAPVTINVLANDTDPDGNPLTITGITKPYSGSAVINAGQTITFKPASGFSGAVQFTYVVKDGMGGVASSTVDVSVKTLVLALGFEEGSGTVASDASGFGNHASVGGASWTAEGMYGGALAFDGVNDLVTVADAGSLDLAQMTLEAWVRPATLAGWRSVIFKQLSANSSEGLAYALYANSGTDGGPGTYIRPSGLASDQHAAGAAALSLNEWHHLAATYNGTVLRLFVDGVQVARRNVTTPIRASARPLFIGGNPLWGEFFKGTIDDVRLYNRALSDIEILIDMGTPVG